MAEGVIDCLASDHAPHLDVEKDREYNSAPFGIIGLETMLPLVVTHLVHRKILSLPEAVRKLSCNPARILRLKNKGSLAVGADADVTVIDLEEEKVIETRFESLSKNSPFIGWKLKGFAYATVVGGRVVMERGKLVSG